MLAFPFFERVPDQSIIIGNNGEKYERLIATRGTDYLLVYNHTGAPMKINLDKISGKSKKAWWYSPRDGSLSYIGVFEGATASFKPAGTHKKGNDWVLILTDSSKDHAQKIE